MDTEADLFASSSLFTSFEDSFTSTKSSGRSGSAKDDPYVHEQRRSVQINNELDADSNCIALDSESADQEELIVIDETGSSDSDNSDVKDETFKNQLSNTDDIQIIENTTVLPITKVDSKPVEITLEDDVVQVKRDRTSNGVQNAEQSELGTILNSGLGIKITFLRPSSDRQYRSLFETFIKSLEAPANKPETKSDAAAEQEVFSDFCIDKTSDTSTSSTYNSVWKVPRYNQTHETLKLEELNEQSPKVNSPKVTCFNCLGDHMIANCTKQKDRKRIAENRDAYMNRCGSLNKSTRYHAEEDLRFSHLKPGHISDNLRRALDLGKYDVPFFIYKMRVLGYPPGWLKDAEVTSSGLTVYGQGGKEVLEDNIEDGEVYESTDIRVQHDPDKLVEYPGFNVFLPYGFKDEHRKFGFPPIQDHQLKSNLRKSMKAPEIKPYKRKNSEPNDSTDKRQKTVDITSNLDGVEMEIEEIEVESNKKEPKPSTSSAVEEKVESDDDDIRSQSPSLEELEQVKKNLLDVLSINSLACSSDTNGSLSQDSPSEVDVNNKISDDSACHTPEIQPRTSALKKQLTFSASKSVELGAPSIKACDSSLPPRESFSVGITEHLPYENLPGTTGQFDKLRSVLKTLRKIRS
ncbi:hypothetical protein CHUAL_013417 [Chamberlinius hualienensis]